MGKLPLLILDGLYFWFFEAPKGLVLYFYSFNEALLKLFSFRLLLYTYFKPWKNEYRKGLVGFSIGMGMFIKSWILLFDILILLLFIILETSTVAAFILWPFATVALFFVKL
jgi:hypothetical protein